MFQKAKTTNKLTALLLVLVMLLSLVPAMSLTASATEQSETFTADGSKTLTFSAADKSAATVAASHTETLTFTISA